MTYTLDFQIKGTKVIGLIINDRGEELFRGEFESHSVDRENLLEQVMKVTEANLIQMEKNLHQLNDEK